MYTIEWSLGAAFLQISLCVTNPIITLEAPLEHHVITAINHLEDAMLFHVAISYHWIYQAPTICI